MPLRQTSQQFESVSAALLLSLVAQHHACGMSVSKLACHLMQAASHMGKSRKRSKLSHTTGYPYKSVKSPSDRGTGHAHEHASFAGK